jgi:hypothetical protein
MQSSSTSYGNGRISIGMIEGFSDLDHDSSAQIGHQNRLTFEIRGKSISGTVEVGRGAFDL